MDWGSVPQWAAVSVAVVAGLIALLSGSAQRDTARRRASLDLLLKTVTDPTFLKSVDEYLAVTGKFFKSGQPASEFFADDVHRRAIVTYLNVLDLIAVGVHNRVLNERVCFDFWADEVIAAFAGVAER